MKGFCEVDTAILLQMIPVFCSALCAILLAWFNRRMDKREKKFEEEERARAMEERERKAENEAILEGLQAILRDRIIQMYAHCEEKKEVPLYAMENMTHMYNAYHILGGNGAITSIYEKFKKISHR